MTSVRNFLLEFGAVKIAVDEVFGLFCLSTGSGDAIGVASWPDGQAASAGIAPVEPEPGDDPPDTVVVAILFILLQTFVDLLQQFPVPPTFSGRRRAR